MDCFDEKGLHIMTYPYIKEFDKVEEAIKEILKDLRRNYIITRQQFLSSINMNFKNLESIHAMKKFFYNNSIIQFKFGYVLEVSQSYILKYIINDFEPEVAFKPIGNYTNI